VTKQRYGEDIYKVAVIFKKNIMIAYGGTRNVQWNLDLCSSEQI